MSSLFKMSEEEEKRARTYASYHSNSFLGLFLKSVLQKKKEKKAGAAEGETPESREAE